MSPSFTRSALVGQAAVAVAGGEPVGEGAVPGVLLAAGGAGPLEVAVSLDGVAVAELPDDAQPAATARQTSAAAAARRP